MSSYSTYKHGKWTQVHDFDDCLKSLRIRFEDQESRITYLQNELNRVKSLAYKDEELANMKKENERLKEDYYRGFPISEEANKKINAWQHDHSNEKHGGLYAGAIGGRFSYVFTPTSIGMIGSVRCTCGEEFKFQDI